MKVKFTICGIKINLSRTSSSSIVSQNNRKLKETAMSMAIYFPLFEKLAVMIRAVALSNSIQSFTDAF